MEGQGKWVYINPNFNKTFHPNLIKPPTTMHVNPAFSQHTPFRHHPNVAQKPKIFINPNFIPPQCGKQPVQGHSNQSFVAFHGGDQLQRYSSQVIASSSSDNIHSVSDCSTRAMKPEEESRLQPVISNSRYSLVRHEQKITTNKGALEKPKSTITISRYKTLKVNDVKKGLENISPSIMPILTEKFNKAKEIVTKKYNKYKFVRQNSKLLTPISKSCKIKDTRKYGTKYKLVRQNSSLTKRDCSGFGSPRTIGKLPIKTKKIPILSIRSRYKYNKTVERKFKKNNIPCPLYRKYGRCLRKDNGTCDFLHDKKHVSICRKFLKGLCFDETCILSHDLSSKKMPTCSFYLKGACSKEDCPYLHVKLNENATICPDFLKGYCEKGSDCIKRHVNMCPNLATKGVCLRKLCPYPHKNNKNKKNINQPKVAASKRNLVVTKVTKERVLKVQDVEKNPEEAKDSRYYKEDIIETSDVCENIKPTRCKIGTLPSFIKL